MKLKYFNQFVFEQAEESEVKDTSMFTDLQDDLKEMIEKSLKTSDEKTLEDFIDAYLRDSEKTQIEGLINDSDIYEFYLKYRNNIDEILSDATDSITNGNNIIDNLYHGIKESLHETVTYNYYKDKNSLYMCEKIIKKKKLHS